MLRVLDLFSGVGGFSLGLEQTGGFRTVGFCEIDPYARRVLARHWPQVPVFHDVRRLNAARYASIVDVVCGGFPCQDISSAGQGRGLKGKRSGLWFEMLRIIDEIRPRYVIAENVAVLRRRGLGVVLGGLAALGYDAEWHCITAAALGAPHRRDRIWIIAYANGVEGRRVEPERRSLRADSNLTGNGACRNVADANSLRPRQRQDEHVAGAGRSAAHAGADGAQSHVADADRVRQSQSALSRQAVGLWSSGNGEGVRYADVAGLAHGQSQRFDARQKLTAVVGTDWWAVEPDVGRVADGVPARVDRLRCLGNAVVPQIPEMIGRAILEAEAFHDAQD